MMAAALPHGAAVDHRLVVALDGGGVVQHHNLRLELPHRRWLVFGVDQDHALADVGPALLFDGKARGSPRLDVVGEALLDMYGLHHRLPEVPVGVGAQPDRVVGLQDARRHNADARDVERGVDDNLQGLLGHAVPVPAHRQQVEVPAHQVEVVPGDIGHVENRGNAVIFNVLGTNHYIFRLPHHVRQLVDTRMLQQLQDVFRGVLGDWLWSHVNACDHDVERDFEGKAQPQVLLCHSLDTVVGGDHNARIIRHRTSHAQNCGL
eukprot:CAMPEP_0174330120 /NCGR_PEP_ID=MMETSP0810-20121108/16414_1 /TAXON_ID=73025 ORGANISM="Eutreptiella gymnastica-like, Strain CCMP1594" /NCGR_SAMPLE_ID=MMETSP0810 /ASSEMBLY_ACC=CAM_ASM_000659 /LENGTH=262 /DNA_ID=CAMNT_0015445079 /DNA_START=2684 /DNA_END=3471 /DNA_ORIENTATION=+